MIRLEWKHLIHSYIKLNDFINNMSNKHKIIDYEKFERAGLNPIDEKQAESINGGYIGIPPMIIKPEDLVVCCHNIPPINMPGDIWSDLM